MFNKSQHFHFIGINGIGMSGVASIMKQQGYNISGCDKGLDAHGLELFNALGCPVATQHLDQICCNESINYIVRSTDVVLDHPELERARSKNIPIIHRADILAEIMRTHFSIAVAGAHGKTTTTSLIAHILLENKIDPTVIIGGMLSQQKTNALVGSSNIVIAEADESDRSFLKLFKTWSIVTNIDLEHMNCYTDIDDICQTFIEFINKTPFYGLSILCSDNKYIQSILPSITAPYATYGLKNCADFRIIDPVCVQLSSSFKIFNKQTNTTTKTINLHLGGLHNIYNATAAYSIASQIGLCDSDIIASLHTFAGVDRRFTIKGKTFNNSLVVDDYGHHPTELECTFKVARSYTKNKFIVAFQPQRYTRTSCLWNDFVRILATSDIDHLFITDIFAASEMPIEGITSQNLVEAITQFNPLINIRYIPYSEIKNLAQIINAQSEPDSIILLQGAGKINQIASDLVINKN